MKMVALEEHFATPEIVKAWKSVDQSRRDLALHDSTEGDGAYRLLDFGSNRISAMADAGIDVQVLSLTTPRVQNLPADVVVELSRASNDRLAEVIRSRPDCFQGFATLPTPVPKAAA